MGLTHAEFFRTLPSALADIASYSTDANRIRIDYRGGHISITLEPEQRRRIALLSIPYVPVRFEFDALEPADTDAFMEHFMRYYQRGGG